MSQFIYSELLEKLDIALGAFYQDNNHFIISAFTDMEEDLIQIVHRNMAEETATDEATFGIALNLSFDPDYPEDIARLERFKKVKSFDSYIHANYDGIESYTKLLPTNSEEAAAIISPLIRNVMLDKKDITPQFEIFETEE
jgi:hypothetical protein